MVEINKQDVSSVGPPQESVCAERGVEARGAWEGEPIMSLRMRKRASFSEKVERFRVRLQDKEWRQYGALLLVGKLLGVALLLGGIALFNYGVIGGSVHAADAPELKAADVVNPLNTVWTLVAAFLVFGMQVGFT